MTLTERSAKALAELDAGRINHALQMELASLVREYHAQATKPAESERLSIEVPGKDAGADLENA